MNIPINTSNILVVHDNSTERENPTEGDTSSRINENLHYIPYEEFLPDKDQDILDEYQDEQPVVEV